MSEHVKVTKPPCPSCGYTAPVVRAGLNNRAGNQRHRCQRCQLYFTAEHRPKGHDPKLREQALHMFRQGVSLRAIGRQLDVHHQSVANWVNAAEARS